MSDSGDTRLEPSAALTELFKIDLSDTSLESVLDRVVTLASRSLPVPAEVSLTVLSKDGPTTVAFAGDRSLRLDETQYDVDDGPCLTSARTGDIVSVPDTATDPRWPEYSTRAQREGIRSSLSLPVASTEIMGAALNFYGEEVDAFDEETAHVAETFARYAAVAIANTQLFAASTRLAEQMQEAMASRAVIEQAKGILMGQHKIDADAAFSMLRAASQRANLKLREIAERIVANETRT
jgi:GAF domain-containing protein